MYDHQGFLIAPEKDHIVLSACKKNETAQEIEDDSGTANGLFTSNLLKVLRRDKTLSYQNLIERVQYLVSKEADDQTPCVQSYEEFNPNTRFLLKDIESNNNRHLVYFKDGKWLLKNGAIYGLPVADKDISVGIYPDLMSENQDRDLLIGKTKIKKVLLKESILDINLLMDKGKEYMGEVESTSSKLLVNLEGQKNSLETFNNICKTLKPSLFSFIELAQDFSEAKYTLKVNTDELVIVKSSTQELVHGKEGLDQDGVEYIVSILERIGEWEKVFDLDNPNSGFTEEDVEVKFIDSSNPKSPYESFVENITIDYPKVGEDKDSKGKLIGNKFEICLKNNTSEKIFVALLYLSPELSVGSRFKCDEIEPKSEWKSLYDSRIGIRSPEKNEVLDVYKIIISTSHFEDYRFVANGKEFKFGAIEKRGKKKVTRTRDDLGKSELEEDWGTRRFIVRTVRRENTINQSDIVIKKGSTEHSAGLIVKGHPAFSADISFSPSSNATKEIYKPKNLERYLNNEYAEILQIKNVKSENANDQSILEFSNIQNKQSLKEDPLELILDYDLEENEKIIPVTFDGEFIIPFGHSELQIDGTTKVSISEIPASSPYGRVKRKGGVTDNPFWMRWMKLKGFEDQVFKVKMVRFNNKGKIVRVEDGVPINVANSKRILLVVHGILGTTESMSKHLMRLYLAGYYDLILAYDYENLDEKIEDIAQRLNQRLEDFKLGPNDGKTLDIIAHSMGGLVSRYLIENIRKGDDMVDRLIMLGTPNGGSVFGDVPSLIKISFKLLTLGINFRKLWSGEAYAYYNHLNELKRKNSLFTTLKQMDNKSEFIKRLWKNTYNGNVEYYIIAGDITKYKSTKNSRLKRFYEKRLLKIGNIAHKHLPNDIAVSVDQIKEIPAEMNAKTYDVICHHMNYFEDGPAMDILIKLASDRKND